MAGELDKSFLRLLPSFSEAKSEVMIDSELIYSAPICLHPKERYLQITNLPIDYRVTGFNPYNPVTVTNEFKRRVVEDAGEFEAFNCLVSFLSYNNVAQIIDCNGNVLKDITANVYFSFFTDINNIQQFAFEILPIQEDFFYKTCYLKFNINDSVFYSNGFYITADDENKTFRLDYNNNGYYQGISYDKIDVYQSIRLFGYLNQTLTKDEVTIYTQLNGKVRRSRPIQGLESKFNIDLTDTFTFERLANCLNSQIVYLNGVRFNTIDNVQSEDRLGKTNLFSTSFKGQFDYNDKFTDSNQIAADFEVIYYAPSGVINVLSAPVSYFIEFNKDHQSYDYVKLYNYNNDSLIQNLTIEPSTNVLEGDLPVLPIGKYYFTLQATSVFGEVLEITDKNTLTFELKNADYSATDYSNNYLR